jgi:hypothetical protein
MKQERPEEIREDWRDSKEETEWMDEEGWIWWTFNKTREDEWPWTDPTKGPKEKERIGRRSLNRVEEWESEWMKGKEESTEESHFEIERRRYMGRWRPECIAMHRSWRPRNREEKEESPERRGWRRIKEEGTERGKRCGRPELEWAQVWKVERERVGWTKTGSGRRKKDRTPWEDEAEKRRKERREERLEGWREDRPPGMTEEDRIDTIHIEKGMRWIESRRWWQKPRDREPKEERNLEGTKGERDRPRHRRLLSFYGREDRETRRGSTSSQGGVQDGKGLRRRYALDKVKLTRGSREEMTDSTNKIPPSEKKRKEKKEREKSRRRYALKKKKRGSEGRKKEENGVEKTSVEKSEKESESDGALVVGHCLLDLGRTKSDGIDSATTRTELGRSVWNLYPVGRWKKIVAEGKHRTDGGKPILV